MKLDGETLTVIFRSCFSYTGTVVYVLCKFSVLCIHLFEMFKELRFKE